jgi:catechol 2,3-dioxygenase-like lactoylglutathione lyase family enzyme
MAVETAVAVQAWDHSVVPVMDLWRAERFYTEMLDAVMFQKIGMTFEWASGAHGTGNLGTFIKLGRNHLGLFLQSQTAVHPPASPEHGYPCWGLAVAADDFAALVARLRAAGGAVGAEQADMYGDARQRAVRCLDSEGNYLELVADPGGRHDRQQVSGLTRLHLEALDLAATAAFYSRYLGLAVAAEGPDWLALGVPSGQRLIFHRVAALSAATIGPYRGRHFAFHVTHAAFRAIVERLAADGVAHGDIPLARRSDEAETYFYDPAGYWLQITTENSGKATARSTSHVRYAPA